jgi:hypothetical protein
MRRAATNAAPAAHSGLSVASAGLRWLLVVPAAAAAGLLGLWLSLLSYQALHALCPSEGGFFGNCVAWYVSDGQDVGYALGAVVGAALVVGLPAAIAPRAGFGVALLAFVVGWALAGSLTHFGAIFPVAFIAATCSGLATLTTVCIRSLAP